MPPQQCPAPESKGEVPSWEELRKRAVDILRSGRGRGWEPSDREDMAQEAVLKTIIALEHGQVDMQRFDPWFYTVVQREAINWYHRHSRGVPLPEAYEPEDERVDDEIKQRLAEQDVEKLLALLPPDERLVQTVYGFATVRYTYDDLGREIRWTFFDVYGEPVHTRVVVQKVEADRAGEQNGLRVGDILVSYDGEDIRDTRTFRELELMPGERPQELRILRQDYELRLQVPPGRLTGLELRNRVPSTLSKLGL